MGKKHPPDWARNATCSSPASMRTLPRPHVREFPRPDGRKRKLSALLMSWAGYAPGASHVHVTVTQENNGIWDGRDGDGGYWTICRDDKVGRGAEHHQRFTTKRAALAWIRTLHEEKYADHKLHVTDNVGSFDNRKFLYAREGD